MSFQCLIKVISRSSQGHLNIMSMYSHVERGGHDEEDGSPGFGATQHHVVQLRPVRPLPQKPRIHTETMLLCSERRVH